MIAAKKMTRKEADVELLRRLGPLAYTKGVTRSRPLPRVFVEGMPVVHGTAPTWEEAIEKAVESAKRHGKYDVLMPGAAR